MSGAGWLQLIVFAALLIGLTPVLGTYMAKVWSNKKAPGDRVFLPVERLIYRVAGVDPDSEQRWTVYTFSLLTFSAVAVLFLYGFERLQAHLPLNPDHLSAVRPDLAWNTAVSFITNTNWQSYGGESTMSHLTQMAGLAVQNFVSAAAGLAVMVALIRALARRRQHTIGNFWVDLVRSTVRILLPLSFVFAIVLLSQGSIDNFHATRTVATVAAQTTHSNAAALQQTIPGGPVASQIAIKQLGTNGGGYFNTNSAHPFENPNGFTDLLEMLATILIPFAATFALGVMVKGKRFGWVIFGSMFVLLAIGAGVAIGFESAGNPQLNKAGITQTVTATQPGGNLEGKEVRFGPSASGLWAASTTGSSNGSVNSFHDSFTPIGGLVPLTNLLLGEVTPGGLGVGLTGMLVLAILTVFIAGLMVGRTPEFLGKKIQAAEMKLVVLHILFAPLVILGFAAASVVLKSAVHSIFNPGPHGLTEVVYAFGSAAGNNGSAFAGLTTNTNWYNVTQGITMLVGRFFLIVPMLGIAGSLVRKQAIPAGPGTFPTDTPLFGALLTAVVVIVAGLTFFPVIALGPLVEHLVGHF
ncbi:MAG TPA: potassium-transporting ATPase subunit KdpA [Acidimicrobiales bacterium]|nr:potassium-transporting ATPase subunit KdpA [Acidimicrobiales bacterium]